MSDNPTRRSFIKTSSAAVVGGAFAGSLGKLTYAVAGSDQIRVIEAGRVLEIPARSSVQEINKLLGSQLSEEGDWETVAGLVIANAHRIPSKGEVLVIGDVEFRVLEADERRVQRLRATLLEATPAEDAR